MEERKKQKMEEEEAVAEEDKKTDEAEGLKSHEEEIGEGKEVEHSEVADCGTSRGKTSFYCKTCSGEPSLCPVPCFELYHTRLIYKTAPELETPGEPSELHQ